MKQSNQPVTGQPAEHDASEKVGELIGRLVGMFHAETGKRFNWTREQRGKIEELVNAHGEADVIATFRAWLQRPRGTDGLEWPLSKFMDDYAGYSLAVAKGLAMDAEQKPVKGRVEVCPTCGEKAEASTPYSHRSRCRAGHIWDWETGEVLLRSH